MLNDEQRCLVEQHEGLIWWFCIKSNLETDEYYGDFAIALCKAAEKYTEEKQKQCKFSTFAVNQMRSELTNIRTWNCKRTNVYDCESLESTERNNSIPSSERAELKDLIPDKIDHFEDIFFMDMYRRIQINQRQRRILNLLLIGFNLTQISRMLRVSPQSIHQTISGSIRKRAYKTIQPL